MLASNEIHVELIENMTPNFDQMSWFEEPKIQPSFPGKRDEDVQVKLWGADLVQSGC